MNVAHIFTGGNKEFRVLTILNKQCLSNMIFDLYMYIILLAILTTQIIQSEPTKYAYEVQQSFSRIIKCLI